MARQDIGRAAREIGDVAMIRPALFWGRIFFKQIQYAIGFVALFSGGWLVLDQGFSFSEWLSHFLSVMGWMLPFVITSSLSALFGIRKAVEARGIGWLRFLTMTKNEQDLLVYSFGYGAFYLKSIKKN